MLAMSSSFGRSNLRTESGTVTSPKRVTSVRHTSVRTRGAIAAILGCQVRYGMRTAICSPLVTTRLRRYNHSHVARRDNVELLERNRMVWLVTIFIEVPKRYTDSCRLLALSLFYSFLAFSRTT